MLLFFDVSGGEIVVILMFVLIFFGSKKIPEMARGLGKGIREIKDASDSIKREIQKEGNKMKDELVNTGQSMLDAAKDEDSTESNQSAEVQEEPKSISSSEEEAPEVANVSMDVEPANVSMEVAEIDEEGSEEAEIKPSSPPLFEAAFEANASGQNSMDSIEGFTW